jgi:hypothetical protein
MRRWIGILLVTALAAACRVPPPRNSRATRDELQRSLGPGVEVGATNLAVRGVELYLVREIDPVAWPDIPRLVGVIGGRGGKMLEGRDLVRAVIATGPALVELARCVLLYDGIRGRVLERAHTDEEQRATVSPPRMANGKLVFWFRGGRPKLLLEATFDPSTGFIAFRDAPLI